MTVYRDCFPCLPLLFMSGLFSRVSVLPCCFFVIVWCQRLEVVFVFFPVDACQCWFLFACACCVCVVLVLVSVSSFVCMFGLVFGVAFAFVYVVVFVCVVVLCMLSCLRLCFMLSGRVRLCFFMCLCVFVHAFVFVLLQLNGVLRAFVCLLVLV